MTTPVLHFDQSAIEGVHIDLEKLVPSRLLVQGSSGAGKSWLLRYILEQTHGRIQQFVFDPEGEFVTLRERFDYVVASAGGDGDVRAHPDTAALLCRQLIELQASAILDIYDLEPEQREEFVGNFLRQLLQMPKHQWRSALVVIDEAHELAPQSGKPPSRKPIELLVSKGRKRGLCSILATQRVSKLSKNASEVQSFLVGLTGLDTDVKRAGELLGFDKEEREQLKRLEPGNGEFFAFGPPFGPTVLKVRSGPVQTHHPKPGEIRAPTPPASGELAELIAQMAATAAAAAAEDGETDAPQSSTTARTSVPPEGWVSPKEVDRRVAAAAKEAEARGRIDGAAAAVAQLRSEVRPYVEALHHALANGHAAGVDETRGEALPTSPPEARTRTPAPVPDRTSSRSTPRTSSSGRDGIGGTPRKMIDAMAALEALGVKEPSRENVAGWVGISASTGTFTSYLSQLRTAGFIEDRPDLRLALTKEGRKAAQRLDVPSLDALHHIWRSKLGGTPAKMLDILIDAYPKPVDREALARAINISHTTGTFTSYLSKLRSPGLIRDVSKGGPVVATDLLFPAGLTR